VSTRGISAIHLTTSKGLAQGLTLVTAVVLWGCGVGGITVESCTLGEDGECPQGHICRATTTTPPGQGICMPGERPPIGSCTPGEADACPEGQTCRDTADTPAGQGTCLPSERCMLDGSWACQADEICLDTHNTPAGEGTCFPQGTCTLSSGTECAQGEQCKEAVGLPPGLGTCMPQSCIPGDDQSCPGNWICWKPEHAEEGSCVPPNHCEGLGTSCGEGVGLECKPGLGLPEGSGLCLPEEECIVGSAGGCGGNQACKPSNLPNGSGLCLELNACVLGAEGGCAANLECKPADEGAEIGLCMEADKCIPGVSGGCGTGTCWSSGDCVPENTCELANDTCGVGLECKPSTGVMDTLGLGLCLAPDKCVPGALGGCGTDESCWSTGDCVPTDTCELANDTCGTGLECKPATDLPQGAGLCMAPDKCIPEALGGCGAEETCWSTGDCVPENTCELANDTCGVGLACKPTTGAMDTLGLGLCLAPDKCVPGALGGCGTDESCWSSGDCVPTDTCELANDTCGTGLECKPATGLPEGAGLCLAEDKCIPEAVGGCGTGTCWSTGDCVPTNTCALENDTCGVGLECKPATDLPEGAGLCLAEDKCIPEAVGGCGTGTCWSTGDCVPTNTCELDNDTCGVDLECKPATGLPGGAGLCLAEDKCIPEAAGGCGTGTCWSTGDCVPTNTCELENDTCGVGLECKPATDLPEGAGLCLAEDKCIPEAVGGCGTGTCWSTGDCVPTNTCELENDTCGVDLECKPATGLPGGAGLCLAEDKCIPEAAGGCGTGTCWSTGDCVPTNTCELENDTCGVGLECKPATDLPEGAGLCLAEDKCIPEAVGGCGTGTCWSTGDCVPTNTCENIGEACGEGENLECKPATGLPGGAGLCLAEDKCIPEAAGGCGTGTCWSSGDCVPTNTCELENDTCGVGLECKPATDLPEGAGLCLAEDKCIPGAGGGCGTGTCWSSGDCVPTNTCENIGEACGEGENLECKPATGLMETLGLGLCLPEDKCVPGSTGGCGEGICLSSGDCVPPNTCTLAGGTECDEAGLSCKGASGLPEGIGLCLAENACIPAAGDAWCAGSNICWDSGAALGSCVPNNTCELDNDLCGGGLVCKPAPGLPEGAGLCLGIDDCYLEMGGGCLEGFECKPIYPGLENGLCMEANKCSPLSGGGCGDGMCWNTGDCVPSNACTLDGTECSAAGFECKAVTGLGLPANIGLCLGVDECVVGAGGACGAGLACKPSSIEGGPGLCLAPEACVPGASGGCEEGYSCSPPESGEIGTCIIPDIAVETGLTQTTLPLAWTDGHVVIGSSDGSNNGSVHFYDTRQGTLSSSENLGPLTGLSSLGDSGRVAITTLERISVLNSNAQFVDITHATDCRSAQGNIHESTRFRYGLSLLSVGNNDGSGNWRFAVPGNANSGNNHQLVAYLPPGSSGSEGGHCWTYNWSLINPAAPLAVQSNAEVLLMRKDPVTNNQNYVYRLAWDNSTSTWSSLGSYQSFEPAFLTSVGVAASDNRYWVSAQHSAGATLAHDGYHGFLLSITDIGAVALDANDSAYVVVKSALEALNYNYEFRRYSSTMESYEEPDRSTSLLQNSVPPVGSPILGEPTSGNPADAEVYLVMTDGTLHAFNAGNLSLKWTKQLQRSNGQPLSISPTAQPLLQGNRLWIIGTQGELRGITVDSNGLRKNAPWPKMHRDNCNSGSQLSTPTTLPSCF